MGAGVNNGKKVYGHIHEAVLSYFLESQHHYQLIYLHNSELQNTLMTCKTGLSCYLTHFHLQSFTRIKWKQIRLEKQVNRSHRKLAINVKSKVSNISRFVPRQNLTQTRDLIKFDSSDF